MTEEERPEAKEQEACFAAIREIVQEISRLMDAAYQQYSRLVEQVLNGSITEEREIERIMDGLVDFGDDPRLLELYKTLCRHVYYKYPALVGEHTALFRLQFEETEDGDTERDEQNSWKEQPTNKANGNRKSLGHLKGAKTIAR